MGVLRRVSARKVRKSGDGLVNNFLLWIGGLVTLCLGLLFAAPHFIDWNGYRGVIEEEASRYFGRRVRLGGEVNLRVLPVPYVSFDKLSIADTSTAAGGPLIRAENFKMWLSVPPLLQGVMEAHHVELRRPVIELITNETGGGNWQKLHLKTGAMSYLPGGFALEALDVIDGQVIVRTASGGELTRFEHINGRLSALAIEGPYKFNGRFKWHQQERTLRLATARPNRDGDVRLKASLASRGQHQRILLDGVLSSRRGRTEFSGDVNATLAGTPATTASSVKNEQSSKPGKEVQPSIFELKSKVIANTTALKFEDINLSLQTDGPPQLMTGDANLKWARDTALDVNLNSRWIDFDRFTMSTGKSAPLNNARGLLIALGRALPAEADTNVRITCDQATLGGEALGRIQLAALRKSGPLKLQEFEANVPGGGKIAISGELSVSRKAPGFNGQLSAGGQSLLKFLRWGLGDDALAPGLTDGPFSLESKLTLGEDSFALSNATADFGGTPLTGALRMNLGEKRDIALKLEGNTIAWNRLSPDPLSVGIARKLLTEVESQRESERDDASQQADDNASPVSSGTFAGLAARSDLSIDLRAAKLVDGDDVYRDFEGKLVVRSGTLSVPTLKFTRDSGLEIDVGAETRVRVGAKRKGQRGTIKGVIAAKSHIAIADLLQFLEAHDLDLALRKRLAALAPLRVASVIELGSTTRPATDMRFDGQARGGRVVATAHFAQGLPRWRTAPARFTATIENDSATRLFSLISDSRTFARGQLGQDRFGRLIVNSAGTPATGLLTRAVVESEGLDLNYYGDVALTEGSPFAFDGHVDFNATSVREAMALVGFELADGVRGLPIKGRFKVVREQSTLRLTASDVAINDSLVTGLITLTEQSNAPSKLVAKLDVDSATLPGVLRAVLAPKKIKASEAPRTPNREPQQPQRRKRLVQKAAMTPGTDDPAVESQQDTPPPMWAKEHFDLSPLTNMEGYITATFDTFAFAGDGTLALNDARLEATVAPGRMSLTKLTGDALGGTTDIAFDITKAPAGVDLSGKLKMQLGKAQNASSAKKNSNVPDAGGEGSPKYAAVFDLAYKGRAFAPEGLAADLDGEGKLILADASLTGLTAKEVRQSVRETMEEQGPVATDAFVAELRDKLKKGQINLGTLDIPVALKDGAVAIAPIEIDGPDGKTTFSSSLEVAKMQFESEWKIAALEPDAKQGAAKKDALLPPITVMYSGSLSGLATVEPRISSGALEREIAVRKMERDVAELERLRKLDEARAKEEEERRRELERSLAEQRRQQAERERRLLLEQQQNSQTDPGGSAPPDGAIDPALVDPDAAADVPTDATQDVKPRRRVRKRRPPPKKDVWNPFQITPY